MSQCTRCGDHVPEGARECPSCGYPVGRKQSDSGGAAYQSAPESEQESYSPPFTDYEILDGENEKTRKMTALCYVGPAFFVPLLLRKDSAYVRFHANQGCVLFLAELVSFGLMYGLLGIAAKIACIALAVRGVKNAAAGIQEKLPYIGKWTIVKQK